MTAPGARLHVSVELAPDLGMAEAVEFLRSLDERLGTIACPVHARLPATRVGQYLHQLYAWTFAGICCEALEEEILAIFAAADASVARALRIDRAH